MGISTLLPLLLAWAACPLLAPLAVQAQPPPSGALIQLAPPDACLTGSTIVGCSNSGAPSLSGASAVAALPEGAQLHLAAGAGRAGLLAFNRMHQFGALSFLDDTNIAPAPTHLAASPDGSFLPSTADNTAAGRGALVRTTRGPGGALGPRFCLAAPGNTLGCTVSRGLEDAQGMAISPDSATIYVASSSGGGTGTGHTGALSVFYAGSEHLRLVQCLPQSRIRASGKCSSTQTPPRGTLGAIDLATGVIAYTPAEGYTGTDSFTFTASDGTNQSPANTASITVYPQSGTGGLGVGRVRPGRVPAANGGVKSYSSHRPAGDPHSHILGLPYRLLANRLTSFHGTAYDTRPIARVQISLVRLTGGARLAGRSAKAHCLALTPTGSFVSLRTGRDRCRQELPFLMAQGHNVWKFRLSHPLAPGGYVLTSRAIDTAGVSESSFGPSRGNREYFSVH